MFTKDAMQAALGFVEAQTSHIEAGVNATIYPDIQYSALIPVDTSAHPYASTVTYYSSDKFGAANWINGNSDDIPLAGTEMQQHQTEVYTAGIGYGYGLMEINQAQMLGRNLASDDAAAARRAFEEMVERVSFSGDTAKGFKGLINNASVTVIDATTGTWSTATPDQILADINEVLLGVSTATAHTSLADTLLMPDAQWSIIATRRLGTNSDLTILDFVNKANLYTAKTRQPLTISAISGLDTAGASGEARMVAYRRNPDVLKLHMPMPHQFLGVYQDGPLNFVVPGVFRLGGLDVRRPAEVRYSDGI